MWLEMMRALENVGLPSETIRQVLAQHVRAVATALERGDDLDGLISRITTRDGITEAGIHHLEQKRAIEGMVIAAFEKYAGAAQQ